MDIFNDSKILLYIITSISVTLNIIFAYLTTRYASKTHAQVENKSKLLEWASISALEDFKQDRQHKIDSTQSMTSYIAFYYSFFNALEKNDKITEEEFIALQVYSDEISKIASNFRELSLKNHYSKNNIKETLS